jgi:hypothetical protein
MWLVLQAWTEFVYVDLVGRFGFQALQRLVTRTPTRPGPVPPARLTAVVEAVRTAGALYIKPAQCLQRATVATRLLRRHGVPAALVIGCRLPPLSSHAWVEVAGDVVSDDRPDLAFYRVLDRW